MVKAIEIKANKKENKVMTKKKIMMAAMSAGLVAVVGVGGTLAYLSAQTDAVTNVFTVGTGYETIDDKTGIYLDEAKVDPATGEVSTTERVSNVKQTYPDLMPGDTKQKDPTVYFVDGSVKSYVFVKVDGTAKAAQNHLLIQAAAWNTEDWKKIYDINKNEVALTDTTGDGYYIYCGAYADSNFVIDREDENIKLTTLGDVFDSITFEDVNNEEFNKVSPAFNDTAITVSACAVQAADDGTDWEDAFADANFAEAIQ